MKKKVMYLFAPDIKYRIFKRLWDSIPDSGPTPMHISKIVWELVKEKRIYAWYENGDIQISINPPKGKTMVITNNGV
jgi:hypothetical protein